MSFLRSFLRSFFTSFFVIDQNASIIMVRIIGKMKKDVALMNTQKYTKLLWAWRYAGNMTVG